MEHRFEVLCKDRTGRGIRRDRVVQESLITVDGKAFCTCMKPKLLHLPCSHLIAACAESGLQPGVFISPYFSKEAAVSTWGHEVALGSAQLRKPCAVRRQPRVVSGLVVVRNV